MDEKEREKLVKQKLLELFKDDIVNEIGLGVTGEIFIKKIKISFEAYRLDCGDDDAPDHEIEYEYESEGDS